MSFSDFVKGAKAAKKKRIERKKTKSLHHNSDLMDVYAENVLNKLKAEYALRSQKGKTSCKIHFNPYPNAEIMRKVFHKVSKKKYFEQFKAKLSARLDKENFTTYAFSDSFLNVKEPVTLTVKW